MGHIKVLYLSHSQACDGSARCLLDILDAPAIRESVEPFVVLPKPGFLSEELAKRGIPFQVVPMSFGIYPRLHSGKDFLLFPPKLMFYQLREIAAERRIETLIDTFRPDLVHSNTGVIRCGYYAAKKRGLPHIWHLREYQDLDFNLRIFPGKKFFIRRLKDPVNTLIAITHGIAGHFSVKSEARVVYDGVRSEVHVRHENTAERQKYFLYVGAISEKKGVAELVRAWAMFNPRHPEFQLKIAGICEDEAFKSRLYDYVANKHLADSIDFLGLRHDIDSLMSHATALVVPSFFEGFGRITPEAMLNFCPVIGRDSAGTAEILKEKKLGLLFRDISGMAACLEEAAQGISGPMIEAAHREACRNYLTEKNAKEILQIYRERLSKERLKH